MRKQLKLFLLILPQLLFAQENRLIKGVVLVSDEQFILNSDKLGDICGLSVRCVELPTSVPKLQTYMAPYYVDQPLNEEQIRIIKTQLRCYFEKYEDPFVMIYVPQQKIKCGVLQIVVKHSSLEQVCVEGNKYYSEGMYKRYLGAHVGARIEAPEISNGISFINRNPFRNAVAIYSPGTEQGTTDLTVAVKEAFPLRIYAGVDNTGIPTIERQRLFQGFNWGKAFGLDHVMSVQHTSSYDFHTFNAWTGEYQAFLPWKHLVRVYGGFSNIHIKTTPVPGSSGKNEGASEQASIRYVAPFTTFANANTHQQFIVGFDYKNTNNTILFSTLSGVVGGYINLSQFVIGYERVQTFSHFNSQIDLQLELFFSPGAMLPNETDFEYQTLRPGAVNHWLYAKAYLQYLQRLPRDFSALFWVRAQAASQNLLPSEQVGIGGFDTVRGYNQQQYTADDAVLFTAEVHSPRFPLFSNFCKNREGDAIEFLAFFDYGYGWNHTRLPGEPKADNLLSIGPGLRYSAKQYISARLDWGIKLHNNNLFSGGSSMVNFSAIVAY
jgi:hemolysin activation/secretion protein